MKMIHTADWHLGNKMHDVDRSVETAEFLAWLKKEIVNEQAETLVVSGDVYDVANPPVESRKQFYSFLASLQDTCCRNVVIVGGNHDSGNLLDSSKELLEVLNIHVIGSATGIILDDMVIELIGADGKENGICIAIPFMREVELRDYLDEEPGEGEFSDKAYETVYAKALSIAKSVRGDRNIPIIATGHMYAADLEGRLKGKKETDKTDDGEKVIDVVGHLGSVHAAIFSDEIDYVALGHIHYSTKVGGNPRIRYSGSPFVMGFDEAGITRYIHSVSIEAGGSNPEVYRVEVPQSVKYLRLSGKVSELKSQLRQKFDDSVSIYLELFYSRELDTDAHDELDPLIERLPKNVKVISWKLADSAQVFTAQIGNLSVDELSGIDENLIFRDFIGSRPDLLSAEMTDEERKQYIAMYLECFHEAKKMLEEE